MTPPPTSVTHADPFMAVEGPAPPRPSAPSPPPRRPPSATPSGAAFSGLFCAAACVAGCGPSRGFARHQRLRLPVTTHDHLSDHAAPCLAVPVPPYRVFRIAFLPVGLSAMRTRTRTRHGGAARRSMDCSAPHESRSARRGLSRCARRKVHELKFGFRRNLRETTAFSPV